MNGQPRPSEELGTAEDLSTNDVPVLHWRPQGDALAAVAGFLDALEALDVEAAMTYLEPGAVYYESTDRSAGNGRETRDLLDWVGATVGAFHSEIHDQVEFGDIVLNERTDYWITEGHELEVSAVGVFETRGGKIISWSDTTSHDLPGGGSPNPPPGPDRSDADSHAPLDDHVVVELAESTANGQAPEAEDVSLLTYGAVLDVSEDAEADHPRVAALEAQVDEWRERARRWQQRSVAAQRSTDSLRLDIEPLRQLLRFCTSKPVRTRHETGAPSVTERRPGSN